MALTDLVEIRDDWQDKGKRGKVLGAAIVLGGMSWTPILWNADEDPDWHKTEGLQEVSKIKGIQVNSEFTMVNKIPGKDNIYKIYGAWGGGQGEDVGEGAQVAVEL